MTRKVFIFITGLLSSFFCFSQKIVVHVFLETKANKSTCDTVFFDPSRLLTWNDFQGKPENNNPGGAVTASGFAFDADIRIQQNIIYLDIGVYTFFSKKDSWKKPQINSAYHLLHEQNHFNITRLGTENFLKALTAANFTKDNYRKLPAAIFDKYYDETVNRQHEYDKETNHSIDQDAQMKWNDEIADEIKNLYNQ